MSNEPIGEVLHKKQIDPGNIDWCKATLDLTTTAGVVTRIADVLATKRANGTYAALTEHWYGFEEGSLADAQSLQLTHTGEQEWDDFPAEWNAGSPSDRNSSNAVMATDVSYTAITRGPGSLFFAQQNGLNLRLHLALDSSGSITEVAWYHDGSSDPAYILSVSGVINFTYGSVNWSSGSWKKFSYP